MSNCRERTKLIKSYILTCDWSIFCIVTLFLKMGRTFWTYCNKHVLVLSENLSFCSKNMPLLYCSLILPWKVDKMFSHVCLRTDGTRISVSALIYQKLASKLCKQIHLKVLYNFQNEIHIHTPSMRNLK